MAKQGEAFAKEIARKTGKKVTLKQTGKEDVTVSKSGTIRRKRSKDSSGRSVSGEIVDVAPTIEKAPTPEPKFKFVTKSGIIKSSESLEDIPEDASGVVETATGKTISKIGRTQIVTSESGQKFTKIGGSFEARGKTRGEQLVEKVKSGERLTAGDILPKGGAKTPEQQAQVIASTGFAISSPQEVAESQRQAERLLADRPVASRVGGGVVTKRQADTQRFRENIKVIEERKERNKKIPIGIKSNIFALLTAREVARTGKSIGISAGIGVSQIGRAIGQTGERFVQVSTGQATVPFNFKKEDIIRSVGQPVSELRDKEEASGVIKGGVLIGGIGLGIPFISKGLEFGVAGVSAFRAGKKGAEAFVTRSPTATAEALIEGVPLLIEGAVAIKRGRRIKGLGERGDIEVSGKQIVTEGDISTRGGQFEVTTEIPKTKPTSTTILTFSEKTDLPFIRRDVELTIGGGLITERTTGLFGRVRTKTAPLGSIDDSLLSQTITDLEFRTSKPKALGETGVVQRGSQVASFDITDTDLGKGVRLESGKGIASRRIQEVAKSDPTIIQSDITDLLTLEKRTSVDVLPTRVRVGDTRGITPKERVISRNIIDDVNLVKLEELQTLGEVTKVRRAGGEIDFSFDVTTPSSRLGRQFAEQQRGLFGSKKAQQQFARPTPTRTVQPLNIVDDFNLDLRVPLTTARGRAIPIIPLSGLRIDTEQRARASPVESLKPSGRLGIFNRSRLDEGVAPISEIGIDISQDSIQLPRQAPITGQKVSQLQQQELVTDQIFEQTQTSQSPIGATFGGFNVPRPKIPVPILFPSVDLTRKKPKKKKKKFKDDFRLTGFAPTLTSAFFGITGERSKAGELTGLGLRPIVPNQGAFLKKK